MRICRKFIGELNENLRAKKGDDAPHLEATNELLNWIVSNYTTLEYGARELRGAIDKYVRNKLADVLLTMRDLGFDTAKRTIAFDYDPDAKDICFYTEATEETRNMTRTGQTIFDQRDYPANQMESALAHFHGPQ